MARLAEVLAAAVMLAAGLLKIWDPPGFALSIARLQVLPHPMLGAAAILVPWIEVAGALALLAKPPWRPAGRAVVAGLLLLFTAVLLAAPGSSSCGCFGVEGGVLARRDVSLLRNVLLLAGLALGLKHDQRRNVKELVGHPD